MRAYATATTAPGSLVPPAKLKDIPLGVEAVADGAILEAPLVAGRLDTAAEFSCEQASRRQIGDVKHWLDCGVRAWTRGPSGLGPNCAGLYRRQNDEFERGAAKQYVLCVCLNHCETEQAGIEGAQALEIRRIENYAGDSCWKHQRMMNE